MHTQYIIQDLIYGCFSWLRHILGHYCLGVIAFFKREKKACPPNLAISNADLLVVLSSNGV